MANIFEPGMPVSLTIDGKEYSLRFTLRVLRELQKDHGISIMRGDDNFTNPEKIGLLLYYGLRTAHPELTLDWIEDHVDTPMLLRMVPSIVFAMSGKVPDAAPNPDKPLRVNGGIGSHSGRSGDSTSD